MGWGREGGRVCHAFLLLLFLPPIESVNAISPSHAYRVLLDRFVPVTDIPIPACHASWCKNMCPTCHFPSLTLHLPASCPSHCLPTSPACPCPLHHALFLTACLPCPYHYHAPTYLYHALPSLFYLPFLPAFLMHTRCLAPSAPACPAFLPYLYPYFPGGRLTICLLPSLLSQLTPASLPLTCLTASPHSISHPHPYYSHASPHTTPSLLSHSPSTLYYLTAYLPFLHLVSGRTDRRW